MLTALLLALPLPQTEAPLPRPRVRPPSAQERVEPGAHRPRVRDFLRRHPRLRAELFERARERWHGELAAPGRDRQREGFEHRRGFESEPGSERRRGSGFERGREPGFERRRAQEFLREHPRLRAEAFERLRERGLERRRPETPPESPGGRLREHLEQFDRDQLIELLLRRAGDAGDAGAAADAPRRSWRT